MAAIHGLRLGDILSSPMIRISAAISLFLLCYATWAAEIVHSASEEEVFALQSAAQSGNRSAIRELFDMHVDGAVAEDIDVVLGRTIRHHPRLFLQELKRNPRANCDRCLFGLLGNTGDEFDEHFAQQWEELKERRDALETVDDQSLLDLREKCVRILDHEIKEVAEHANQRSPDTGT